jgi:hypothetical protein
MSPAKKRQIYTALSYQLNRGHAYCRSDNADRALLHPNDLVECFDKPRRAINMKTVASHGAEKKAVHPKANGIHCGERNQKLVPEGPPVTCGSAWKRGGATKISRTER